MNILKSESAVINCELSRLLPIMHEEVDEALEVWREVEMLANPPPTTEISSAGNWEGTESLLITLQNAYKQVVALDFEKLQFLDMLKHLVKILRNSGLDKVRYS